VLQTIVKCAIAAGARLARPGEFTLRAFLNGKRDLVQAEAVADLIDAATPLQARLAFDQLEGTLTGRIQTIDATLFDLMARLEASLDFPDEGYHFVAPSQTASEIANVVGTIEALLADAAKGRVIREGATVVIAGRPNTGKSSIFNRLSGFDRAIVTEVPGTTRDLVTETVDMEGIAISLVDTAGWRETGDVVEREGVERGVRARGVAELLLVVLDNSEPIGSDDERLLRQTQDSRRIVVLNKIDLVDRTEASSLPVAPLGISALTGEGFDRLRARIVEELTGDEPLRDAASVSNTRHIALLEECREVLEGARNAAAVERIPEEFLLRDLQTARLLLDEIVGRRTSDDVLQHIFERFCIGK
jgi:tRNA modification GTPase